MTGYDMAFTFENMDFINRLDETKVKEYQDYADAYENDLQKEKELYGKGCKIKKMVDGYLQAVTFALALLFVLNGVSEFHMHWLKEGKRMVSEVFSLHTGILMILLCLSFILSCIVGELGSRGMWRKMFYKKEGYYIHSSEDHMKYEQCQDCLEHCMELEHLLRKYGDNKERYKPVQYRIIQRNNEGFTDFWVLEYWFTERETGKQRLKPARLLVRNLVCNTGIKIPSYDMETGTLMMPASQQGILLNGQRV